MDSTFDPRSSAKSHNIDRNVWKEALAKATAEFINDFIRSEDFKTACEAKQEKKVQEDMVNVTRVKDKVVTDFEDLLFCELMNFELGDYSPASLEKVVKKTKKVVEQIEEDFPGIVSMFNEGVPRNQTLKRLKNFEIGGFQTYPTTILAQVLQARSDEDLLPFNTSKLTNAASMKQRESKGKELLKEASNLAGMIQILTDIKTGRAEVLYEFAMQLINANLYLHLKILDYEKRELTPFEYEQAKRAIVKKHRAEDTH